MAPRPHPSPPAHRTATRRPPAAGGPTSSPSAGLAQVALIVLGEQPLGQVLEHVTEVTAATVPGAGEVSVILVEGARARGAGFSGPVAAALDERQYAQELGPCLSYCTSGSLAASSSDLGRVFAAYAWVALSNALVFTQATDSVSQMREAMISRAGIEQAKGILMGRHGISADDAFEQLARRSQLENRKVRHVADDVVRAAGGPVPELV